MTGARSVKTRHLIAYGMGDIFGGGSFLLISMFFLFFLTEEVGLPPWLGTVVIGVGRVWDGISDPLMGYLSDRTRSRYGRRRGARARPGHLANAATSTTVRAGPSPTEET